MHNGVSVPCIFFIPLPPRRNFFFRAHFSLLLKYKGQHGNRLSQRKWISANIIFRCNFVSTAHPSICLHARHCQASYEISSLFQFFTKILDPTAAPKSVSVFHMTHPSSTEAALYHKYCLPLIWTGDDATSVHTASKKRTAAESSTYCGEHGPCLARAV